MGDEMSQFHKVEEKAMSWPSDIIITWENFHHV